MQQRVSSIRATDKDKNIIYIIKYIHLYSRPPGVNMYSKRVRDKIMDQEKNEKYSVYIGVGFVHTAILDTAWINATSLCVF